MSSHIVIYDIVLVHGSTSKYQYRSLTASGIKIHIQKKTKERKQRGDESKAIFAIYIPPRNDPHFQR